MALVTDLAAAASGAAAVLALALTWLAWRAHRTTRSPRSRLLSIAFLVAALQAGLTGWLLARSPTTDATWLAVPAAHLVMLAVMYVALLRV